MRQPHHPKWGIAWILVWTLALPALPAAVLARTWEPVVHAREQQPQRVIVNKRSRAYFLATEARPIRITVQGPARLKVVTRAPLAKGVGATVSYTVRVAEEGRTLKAVTTQSAPAPSARVADRAGPVLCKSRTFRLRIPDGAHRLSISVSGIPALYARILVAAPKSSGATMVAITPVQASRSVTVSEGGRLIPFYTVLPGRPIKLRIVGPTRLELSTRLDYDLTMRGHQQYMLRIANGVRPLRDVRFRTTKSAVASYTDLKERIPSKLDRVVLPLGPGVHELTVDLLEPRSGAVEVRAQIPQSSVGTGE